MFRVTKIITAVILLATALKINAAPIQLPVYESFDKVGPTLKYEFDANGPQDIDGLPGWSFNTTFGGQLEFISSFEIHAGSEYIAAMDNPGNAGLNQLAVTFDASDITVANDQLILSFRWYDSGDEPNAEDIVSVRGSDTAAWVTVYDFGANSNNGSWRRIRNIDLSAALSAAGQEFSGTAQVRFQQTDDFAIPRDGIAIEDVSIELSAASADSGSTQPLRLVATMADYFDREVSNGGEVEYKVSLFNPSDLGASTANSVLFRMPSFGPESSLVVGSVITSRGTVVVGNNVGDDEITVSLGDLFDGKSATIYFRVKADFNNSSDFFNQGEVSAIGISTFFTEDPRRESGSTDPTKSTFRAIITDFAISSANPTVGETPTVSATGTGSSEPIIFTSNTPTVCQIQNDTMVELLTVGTCILLANQAGDITTDTAQQSTLTFEVASDSSFYVITIPGAKVRSVTFEL